MRRKLTISEFIEKAKLKHGEKYKYDYSKSVYINARTKVDIICPKHGLFNQICNNHLKGMGCPVCKSSKGELKIIKFLEENNINYISQYTFDDCRFKNKLSFDFYLPDYNMCVEYNGEQHYQIIKGWGGEKNYELRKIRDKIKKEYCELNNIPFYIIKYDEVFIR